MYNKKIKPFVFKFFFFLIIVQFIAYLSSCQIEETSMKRVTIVNIPKNMNNQNVLKIIEHYQFSYIFYRKNFIYFFDTDSKTLYKFTKTGDILLKISNRDKKAFNKLSYLNPLNKKSVKTKIERYFPFPDVLGIYVDYQDNIFLKVNYKIKTDFLKDYAGKHQKVFYLFNSRGSGYKTDNMANKPENADIETTINNNGPDKKDLPYEEKPNKEYNIAFLEFDKYGDLKNIICKSKNSDSFNYFTRIHFFKDNSFIISEQYFSGNEEAINEISSEYHDGIFFYLGDKNFKIKKKINFSLTDIPKTETEKNRLYNLFIINYLISEDKSILFDIYYYKNNIPEYYKIIKLSNLDINNIYTIYQKQLLVDKIIDGKKKKVLLFGEYLLDITSDNFYFFIKYIDEKNANLIIKDRYFKTLVSKLINVEDIYSENQFFVGGDGSLFAYSDISNSFDILYWASDVILRKITSK